MRTFGRLLLNCILFASANTMASGQIGVMPQYYPHPAAAPSGGASRPFTALHTYFMAPNGNDSCNGTSSAIGSSGNCAWATPNHNMVCGDVLVAAAGTYNVASNWLGNPRNPTPLMTVSGCPSSSGGIDGTGGIYFAVILCGGADLEACKINYTSTGAGCRAVFHAMTNNVAIEGFKVSTSDISSDHCFESDPAKVSHSTVLHHFAAINNICYNAGQAFDLNDDGANAGQPTPGTDYIAAVGLITQNATALTAFGVCVAAIDVVGPANWDNVAGTHMFLHGNFVAYSNSPNCVSLYDGEAIMLDSYSAHSYTGLSVVSNNMAWRSTRSCLQLTSPTNTVDLVLKFHNNTCYDNNVTAGGNDSNDGEYNPSGSGTYTTTVSVINNILNSAHTTSSHGVSLWGAVWGGGFFSNLNNGKPGSENIVFGVNGQNQAVFNGNSVGTNFLESPGFTNTTDLINNHTTTVPNCTGFVNTTACMGWNANTQTLTVPSVISDLTPTCADCGNPRLGTGKGYQYPSTTCVISGTLFNDFPKWLKGIVYLHWTGTAVVQNFDLVTLPCGL
jgi:hypothetical protein